jgi:hypothetical protein
MCFVFGAVFVLVEKPLIKLGPSSADATVDQTFDQTSSDTIKLDLKFQTCPADL